MTAENNEDGPGGPSSSLSLGANQLCEGSVKDVCLRRNIRCSPVSFVNYVALIFSV